MNCRLDKREGESGGKGHPLNMRIAPLENRRRGEGGEISKCRRDKRTAANGTMAWTAIVCGVSLFRLFQHGFGFLLCAETRRNRKLNARLEARVVFHEVLGGHESVPIWHSVGERLRLHGFLDD